MVFYFPTSYNGFDEQDFFAELISGKGNKPARGTIAVAFAASPSQGMATIQRP